MPIPTRILTVDVFQVIGTALPNVSVQLTLTRADILADGSGLVPKGSTIIVCDVDGHGTGDIFPNALGTLATQYGVVVFDEHGVQVFPDEGPARMYMPDEDSLLHAILFTVPPLSQSDADAAVIAARDAAAAVGYIYPGTYATAPTERPDGSPLQDGDRYINFSTGFEYVRIYPDWFSPSQQSQQAANASMNSANDAAAAAVAAAAAAVAAADAAVAAADAATNGVALARTFFNRIYLGAF